MTNMIDITLRPGCAIRKIRQDKGWTIKQLAEKSGVHHNQVARIELKNTGGWFTIVSIFQTLGVSISFGCQSKQLTRLQAECEKLRKDAERWRYVSLQGDDTHWLNLLRVDLEDFDGNINAAVDALIDGEAPVMAAKMKE